MSLLNIEKCSPPNCCAYGTHALRDYYGSALKGGISEQVGEREVSKECQPAAESVMTTE